MGALQLPNEWLPRFSGPLEAYQALLTGSKPPWQQLLACSSHLKLLAIRLMAAGGADPSDSIFRLLLSVLTNTEVGTQWLAGTVDEWQRLSLQPPPTLPLSSGQPEAQLLQMPLDPLEPCRAWVLRGQQQLTHQLASHADLLLGPLGPGSFGWHKQALVLDDLQQLQQQQQVHLGGQPHLGVGASMTVQVRLMAEDLIKQRLRDLLGSKGKWLLCFFGIRVRCIPNYRFYSLFFIM